MHWTFRALPIVAGLTCCACGAEDPPPSLTEAERTQRDESPEVAAIRQALAEPGCGTIAADGVLVPDPSGGSVTSPDGSYDHPECRNAFVVDIQGTLEAGRRPSAGDHFATEDPFGCLFTYAYAGLWEKQGDSYQLVQQVLSWGYAGLSKFGWYCSLHAEVTTPREGEYRVVAASGPLFGPTSQVRVGLAQPTATNP